MADIDEVLWQKPQAYASRHRIRIGEKLGSGVHGLVLVADRQIESARTAIKVHREREAYERERSVYERLAERSIVDVRGFHVPRMIGCDESLWIVEMTIVTRPFVLDFAGAYLDRAMDFPEDVWNAWETEKREQFGDHWSRVQQILGTLESYGIFMTDVSPGNIGL